MKIYGPMSDWLLSCGGKKYFACDGDRTTSEGHSLESVATMLQKQTLLVFTSGFKQIYEAFSILVNLVQAHICCAVFKVLPSDRKGEVKVLHSCNKTTFESRKLL